MMSSIHRYLFSRFTRSYLTIAIALAFVIWLIQSVNLIDNLVGSSDSTWQLMGLLSLTLPRVLTFVLAPALLVAVVVQFIRMLQTHEYFALTASGLSPSQILRPILLLAALVTLAQAILAFYVAPVSMKTLRMRSVQSAIGLAGVGLSDNSFRDITPTLTVFVGQSLGSNQWQRVMIQDSSGDGRITYIARKGQISQRDNTAYFLLESGSIHTDHEGQEADILSFGEYVLPLVLPTPELRLNRNHMMIHQLLAPQRYGIRDTRRIERMQSRARQTISNLAAPFIFVLLAYLVTTSNHLSRRGYGRRIIVAAMLGVVFQLTATILASDTFSNGASLLSVAWPLIWLAGLSALIAWQSQRQILWRNRNAT